MTKDLVCKNEEIKYGSIMKHYKKSMASLNECKFLIINSLKF